jgi:hypothetical protein
MYPVQKFKRFTIAVSILIFGCSTVADINTPPKIGEKKRLGVVSGQQAAQVVNRMHGRSVATDANVIAEYGNGQNKDILYISRYAKTEDAQNAFELMIVKMKGARKSPFYHLRPIGKYQKKVYMTLGMGAVHYIYRSGSHLIWFQTYQSFGDEMPPSLLDIYPI